MKLINIQKASYPHKYVATFSNGKRSYFGHQDYEDYTQHHDKIRRQLYRIRHKKDLRTNDPTAPGYLSYYILWGDSTDIHTNIKAYKEKFNL